ncbi:hypothetical protein J15TS10_43710 [Paenibacillus woosongensis]|uniref:Uncharacterized protein n=1 Tax=Paenibacillus woosongensis TaxID=307580 RepID=A0ABQ4MXA6_9BACL|nr:hypothetical protein J15TS10_43710 [Paenibacillus woosongensis]
MTYCNTASTCTSSICSPYGIKIREYNEYCRIYNSNNQIIDTTSRTWYVCEC